MRAFEGQQAGVGADSEVNAGQHGVHLRRLDVTTGEVVPGWRGLRVHR